MKNAKHTQITLDSFWNPNRVSLFRLLFRILVGIVLVWYAVSGWINPYRSTLAKLFGTLVGLWGLCFGGKGAIFLTNNHLTWLWMAVTGSLGKAREDFLHGSFCGETTCFGREYLFCMHGRPVAYRSIHGFSYWDSKIYYRSRLNIRRILHPVDLPEDHIAEWLTAAEPHIRNNPGFLPSEYVPKEKLPLRKRIRKLLSCCIPHLIVERRIEEKTAGVGTLFLHLMNIFYFIIGYILLTPFFMMLKDLAQMLPLSGLAEVFVCLLFLGFACAGVYLILKLPLLLLKKKHCGELEAVVQDFNASQKVLNGLFIGKKYIFRSSSTEILSLDSISRFLVKIRSDRHWAIYYQPVTPGSSPVLFYTGIRSGHHELVDILNQYLPKKEPNLGKKHRSEHENPHREPTEEEKHWDRIVNEILEENAEKQP